ncbi:hypothetical protein L207DRAFT_520307 [Hyaloscypha variabilis F]|uniref:Uncharacterized protein n=1 Tax=Hyaloscypha variabilis (strain UAMH 11265 / GT02V1 / F) TaxID=1149755 RepID=A0A2J6QV77_HYAVF|nr:hypothetical protein L207DRAFT_520307 [Hyaloscypha variabilis F]
MSDTEKGGPGLEGVEGVELDDDVTVFDVGMFDGGAEGTGFHTKNNAKDPYQRSEVIQRTGAVDIRCTVVDIIHGAMSANSDCWATLMVLQFRFDPQKRARRIAAATIELRFDALDLDGETPEVEAISFDGNFSLMPSKQTESITKGATGTAGASYGANLGLEAKWEKTVNRETTDATTVSGGRFVVNNQPPNCVAKWTLLENKTLKSGIPASLRVAVLIKRRDERDFACLPKLEVRADRWTRVLEKFSGKMPEDDPVILKPSKKPTNKLMVYDTEELGSVVLQSLSDITFTTMIGDGLKNQV